MPRGETHYTETRTHREQRGGPHFQSTGYEPVIAAPKQQSWSQACAEWLRALYFARFSLVVVLVLAVIGPLGRQWLPSMLGALFLLTSPMQMLWVTIVSMLVAAMARVCWGVTLLNAPRRFHDCVHISRRCLRWSPWDWIPTAGVGLLPPLYCLFATQADWSSGGVEGFPAYAYWVAIGTGVVAVTLALFLATVLQERLSGPEHEPPGLLPFEWLPTMERLRNRRTPSFVFRFESPLARLLSICGPGYTRTSKHSRTGQIVQRLAPGHFQSMLCLFVTFAAYVALGYVSNDLRVNVPWFPPALCFTLLALLLVGWAMSALAFFLDRYRVPVLTALLGMSFLSYWGFGLDHYYQVTFNAAAPTERPPRLEEVIHPDWKIPRGPDHQRTLVVVTASGGGIQASAWTAKVLCGLHERYPRHFAQSLGLLSGVSGGSVGVMCYLVHLQSGEDPLDDEATSAVLASSRASSLDAAAWGIVYPDLVRNCAPPLTNLLFSKYTDRGSAIETAWSQFVRPSESTVVGSTKTYLHQLVEPMKAHKLPVVVFNSVIVETGQRLLISPVCQHYDGAKRPDEPQEFLNLYRGAQLSLATGARLSATFPFVSPICRPTPSPMIPETSAYHVADGAYADNEGIVTAVDWINQLCEFYSLPKNEANRPFDRVLFVRVQPFPARGVVPADTNSGWAFATSGPLKGMLNVRQASQAERGNLEANLLTAKRKLESATRSLRMRSDKAEELATRFAPAEDLAALDTQIAEQSASTAPPKSILPFRDHARDATSGEHRRGRPSRRRAPGIEIDTVTITFDLAEPEAIVPLSWKLSTLDKRRIDATWQRLIESADSVASPLAKLDRYFPREGAINVANKVNKKSRR